MDLLNKNIYTGIRLALLVILGALILNFWVGPKKFQVVAQKIGPEVFVTVDDSLKARFTLEECSLYFFVRLYHPGFSLRSSRQSIRYLEISTPQGLVMAQESLFNIPNENDFFVSGTPMRHTDKGMGNSNDGKLHFRYSLPPDFMISFEWLSPWDLNLFFGTKDLKNGTAVVLNPQANERGIALVRQGFYGNLKDFGPFENMTFKKQGFEFFKSVLNILALAAAFFLLCLTTAVIFLKTRTVINSQREWVLVEPRRILIVAFFSALVSWWVWYFGLEQLPHVSDEIAYLFQARIFERLRLAAPWPPLGSAFEMYHVIMDDFGWRAKYPPFWSLFLAVGEKFNLVWMVNLSFSVSAVLLLYAWAKQWVVKKEAWLAAAGLAMSPFMIMMSASFFNHTAALVAAIVFLKGVWEIPESKKHAFLVAGAGLAVLTLFRSYTGFLFFVFAAVWLWSAGFENFKKSFYVSMGLATVFVFSVFVSNLAATGNIWWSPYLLYDSGDRPGFGSQLGSLLTWGSAGHNWIKAMANTNLYLNNLAPSLAGWPWALGLSPIILNLALRRLEKIDFFLIGSVVILIGGHFFYWCLHLITLGPFYWFQALAPLAWLWARGLVALNDFLKIKFARAGSAALVAVVIIFTAWQFLFFLPAKTWGLRGFAQVESDLATVSARLQPIRALIFVRDDNALSYYKAFALQDPWLNQSHIFVRSRGYKDLDLIQLYPSRQPLYWDGRQLYPYGFKR
jgi:hypothetical protein